MNRMFATRMWAHAHHGAVRMHGEPRHEAHEDILGTLAVVTLVVAVVVLALMAQTLYPNMKVGTGYMMNQFDPSSFVSPWGTPNYNSFASPFAPYPLDGGPVLKGPVGTP